MSSQETFIDPETAELVHLDQWGVKWYHRICADPWCKYPFITDVKSKSHCLDRCRTNHNARLRRARDQDEQIARIMRGEMPQARRGRRGGKISLGPIPDIIHHGTPQREDTPQQDVPVLPPEPTKPVKMPELSTEELLNLVPLEPDRAGFEMTDLLDKYLGPRKEQPPKTDSK